MEVIVLRKPSSPKIKVVVGEDIIRNSVSRDSSHCMIAEALKASYPEGSSVSVDIQTIRVSNPKKRLRYTYLTPRLAQVSLIKFDQGLMPEPFEFSLRHGQVTKMIDSKPARAMARADRVVSEKMSQSRHENLAKAQRSNPVLTKASLRDSDGKGTVPDRIGGRTPPLSRTKDGVPFSKRRAFGLRGMDR